METRFFKTQAAFRAWLVKHHASSSEVGVVLYTKGATFKGMTWSEAVDVALCFGWIDGISRRRDESSRVQRFTPRRPRSNWSAVNIRKVEELTARGLMTPSGLAAFALREKTRSAVYSYENRHLAALDPGLEAIFRADAPAWEFFARQPPSYRQTATYWVMNARREETRARRLAKLMDASVHGHRMTW